MFICRLSGIRFVPEYLKRLHLDTESFYSSPKWQTIQDLFLVEVSKRVVTHKSFLGFDIATKLTAAGRANRPRAIRG